MFVPNKAFFLSQIYTQEINVFSTNFLLKSLSMAYYTEGHDSSKLPLQHQR